MKKEHIKVTERIFSYQTSTSLVWLVYLFSFIPPPLARLNITENSYICINYGTTLFKKVVVASVGHIRKESCKVFVQWGAIILGRLSDYIVYVDKPSKKEMAIPGQFTSNRKMMSKKSTHTPSQLQNKESTVSNIYESRNSLCVFTSRQYNFIIPVTNFYKVAAIGVEVLKAKNIIPRSKNETIYASFVRIETACYTFYALREPPLPYLKS